MIYNMINPQSDPMEVGHIDLDEARAFVRSHNGEGVYMILARRIDENNQEVLVLMDKGGNVEGAVASIKARNDEFNKLYDDLNVETRYEIVV